MSSHCVISTDLSWYCIFNIAFLYNLPFPSRYLNTIFLLKRLTYFFLFKNFLRIVFHLYIMVNA